MLSTPIAKPARLQAPPPCSGAAVKRYISTSEGMKNTVANELSHDGWAGDEHLQIPFKSCSSLAFRKAGRVYPRGMKSPTRCAPHLNGFEADCGVVYAIHVELPGPDIEQAIY